MAIRLVNRMNKHYIHAGLFRVRVLLFLMENYHKHTKITCLFLKQCINDVQQTCSFYSIKYCTFVVHYFYVVFKSNILFMVCFMQSLSDLKKHWKIVTCQVQDDEYCDY